MIIYTTIVTDEDDYRLSALLTDKGYEMASLQFLLDGEETGFWDNDIFLYETVYPYLKGEKTSEDEKLKNEIPPDDHGDVLELFEKGIELGFFKYIYKI
jgi:hypothetical protein